MSDPHGIFIWYELMTSDQAGAKAFYSDVVGWTTNDMDMGGMTYTMVEADGHGVGGIFTTPPEAKAMNVPPHWAGYIAVHDCDAAAAQAEALGGRIHKAPEDILGIGRFAVVADPAGAVFCIMTPAPMDTAPPRFPQRGTPGHASWRELYGADPDAGGFDFYARMFGWTKDIAMPMGEMGTYQLFANAEGVVGAMMRRPPQVPVAAWNYYFQVGDIDQAVERVKSGGGQVLNGPMEVPGEDWVINGMDPQGAMFSLVGKRG